MSTTPLFLYKKLFLNEKIYSMEISLLFISVWPITHIRDLYTPTEP